MSIRRYSKPRNRLPDTHVHVHVPRDHCWPACHLISCPSSRCNARVNANSILVVIVSAAKFSMQSNDSYSSSSTELIDDSWLILDSLHMYMTISTHYHELSGQFVMLKTFCAFNFRGLPYPQNVDKNFLHKIFLHEFFSNYGTLYSEIL